MIDTNTLSPTIRGVNHLMAGLRELGHDGILDSPDAMYFDGSGEFRYNFEWLRSAWMWSDGESALIDMAEAIDDRYRFDVKHLDRVDAGLRARALHALAISSDVTSELWFALSTNPEGSA